MNTLNKNEWGAEGLPRRSVLGLMLGGVLSACGGGGGSQLAGISSGGTGSFTTGSIVGFGSIIVNGVRYVDTQAQVANLDDDAGVGNWRADQLQMGMVVAVQGSNVKASTAVNTLYTHEGVADRIVAISELLGPVAALTLGRDANQQITSLSFDVLGQPVTWSADTAISLDGLAAGVDQVREGRWVEVYGFWDGNAQVWQATRLDLLTTLPGFYRLSGEVSLASADRTQMSVAGQALRVDGAAVDAGVADGVRVRAVLDPTPSGSEWVATRVRLATSAALPLVDWSVASEDGRMVELEGVVPPFTGTRFMFEGVEVDVSQVLAGGRVVAGRRVELKGQFASGVLRVTQVEGDDEAERQSSGFELHGVVTAIGSNSLQVRDEQGRGYTVYVDAWTDIEGVAAVGEQVEAKLSLQLDGTWLARELHFEANDD